MSRLIDLVLSNEHFKVLDAGSGESHTASQLVGSVALPETEGKGLLFLYLDQQISSVAAILHLYQSPHAGAFFSSQINESLKTSLEGIYTPDFIFDKSREEITGYQKLDSGYFQRSQPSGHEIHADLKVLLATSGSTGSPKLVKISEKNLIANAEAISDYLPIDRADVCPLNLPLSYSYGLSVLNSNALAGGQVVAGLGDIMTPGFWKAFDEFGFTTLAGVPIVYEILKRFKFTTKTYPSLRYMTQAGGRLSNSLIELFHEYANTHNISFYVMYGQTEATARMSYLHPENLPAKIGSIGKAIPGGSLSIDPESSELIFEGDNVFGGYANTAADLSSFSQGNRLITGDLARKDEEGFFYITGRSKRIIKIDGSRFNLDDIEVNLEKAYPGTPISCLSLDDELLAVVSTATIDQKAVATKLSRELKIRPVKVKCFQVDEFPTSANGKVDMNALKSTLQEGLSNKKP